MMANYRFHGVWEVDGLEDVCADIGVDLHSFKFGGRQGAWLVQYVFGYREFPRVVQESGRTYCVQQFFIPYVEFDCERHRVTLNSPDMSVSYLVFRINSQS